MESVSEWIRFPFLKRNRKTESPDSCVDSALGRVQTEFFFVAWIGHRIRVQFRLLPRPNHLNGNCVRHRGKQQGVLSILDVNTASKMDRTAEVRLAPLKRV